MAETVGLVTYSSSRTGGVNADNVISDTFTVPDNGWITEIDITAAGGYNETTYARLCVWDSVGALLWASPQQTWAASLAVRSAIIPPAEAVRVSKNQVVRIGFWRDPAKRAQWGLTGQGPSFFGGGGDQHQAMTYTAAYEAPRTWSTNNNYSYNLSASFIFERNANPLKGAWRPPTPVGPTGELNPYFSGTMPHASEAISAVPSGDVTINPVTNEPQVQPEADGTFKLAYARNEDTGARSGPMDIFYEEVVRRTTDNQSIAAARATQDVRLTGDGNYDTSVLVRVQVLRNRDAAVIVDKSFEPTATENEQGYFERQLYIFPNTNEDHTAYFAHRDSWGIWSVWSDAITFRPYSGPASPTTVGPEGQIDANLTPTYSSLYTHPQNQPANAARVRLFGYKGTTMLYDSGTKVLGTNASPGSLINILGDFHSALLTGAVYQWQMQTRDILGIWSAWSPKLWFNINFPPSKPMRLEPSGGRPSSETTLRGFVYDIGLDTITQAQVDLFKEDGTHISGYPKDMTMDSTGFWATYNAVADLVNGTDYKWNMRAFDGTQWGDWSDYAHFRYIQAPVVTMYSPMQGGVTNLVKQPSAEYDPAVVGAWWTQYGNNAGNYIARINDENAYQGVTSWEMVSDGTATHGQRSNNIPIDPTKHFWAIGAFKRLSGDSRHRFYVEFLNASGTVVYSVAPSLIVSPRFMRLDYNVSTAAIGTAWQEYGGLIANGDIPDTATQARLVVERLSGGTASVLRFDAFLGAVLPTNDIFSFTGSDGFWGYIDGDTETYAITDDRVWRTAPGNSESSGPAVLIAPSITAEIGYTAPYAKVDDRYVLEQQQTTGSWITVSSTAYASNGNRVRIPIPTSAVRNRGRYRLTIYVKDTQGTEGRTPAVEFDVAYAGPNEPVISQVAGDPMRGELVVEHDPTDLDPNVFSFWEIRVTEEGGEPVTYINEDHAATRFVYPFPLSDVEYTFEIRQVQQIGAEQVESPWTTVRGTVNYFPLFFLKSVTDPFNENVVFKVQPSAVPTENKIRPKKQYITWGSQKPRMAYGLPNYEEGSVTVRLYVDRDVTIPKETRLAILWNMIDKAETWVFLAHFPTRKRYIALKADPSRAVTEIEDYELAIEHTEVEWEEDVFAKTITSKIRG